MADTTLTTLSGATLDSVASTRLPSVPALVVLWSRHEPERAGEVALVGGPDGTCLCLGREQDSPEALGFMRQRPGPVLSTGPLQSPRVSRRQLELRRGAAGLRVKNVGRLGLFLWPRARAPERRGVVDCEPEVGDLLELEDELLLLVTERPALLGWPGQSRAPSFVFGSADADGVVGESLACWRLRSEIAFIAPRAPHVLIRGESGCGKELVAQALHRHSLRGGRLVARNAATIPEGLADAELFGNAKNYPHAGMPERFGLIGEADGGTLFLDEFAELPEQLQARLLRVLDAGEYQRLGEARARTSDFRLVAATNRPESAIKHDVLARFALRLELPTLNERSEDVPLLARELVIRAAADDEALLSRFFEQRAGSRAISSMEPRLSLDLVASLVQRRYTTHVRELSAFLWASLAESRGRRLEVPRALRSGPSASAPPAHGEGSPVARTSAPPHVDPLSLSPETIAACLERHGGEQEPVWRELGLSSRHVLTRLVRRYGLQVRGRSRG